MYTNKVVYIVTGYTDLCFAMDRWSAAIESQPKNWRYIPDTLCPSCKRQATRAKSFVCEDDSQILLYKRLSESRFQWSCNFEEVRLLTLKQFPCPDIIKKVLYGCTQPVAGVSQYKFGGHRTDQFFQML